jgi:Entner-Doudoroff aldolase
MSVLEEILANRIVVIYRGMEPEDCLEASRALVEAGIRLFEVTMNSPDTVRAIELLRSELGSRASIGAGTVTSPEQVDIAAGSGATYIVSPNTDPAVIGRTRDLGLTPVPGAFSPTEVLAARDAGADVVKVFPIASVGPEYVKHLKGPIDDVPFMVTGGIKLEMVEDLFLCGADAIGISARLLGGELVGSKDWDGLRERAAEFLAAAGVRVLP